MPEWKEDLDLYLDQYGKEIIKEVKQKVHKRKGH